MKTGDRVRLTLPVSVAFFSGPRVSDAMPLTGEIIEEYAPDHPKAYEGTHLRPWLIRFDDGREGQYAGHELKVIPKEPAAAE